MPTTCNYTQTKFKKSVAVVDTSPSYNKGEWEQLKLKRYLKLGIDGIL